MIQLLEMELEELLQLNPDDVRRELTADELRRIATQLDAFWEYDYYAADTGKLGYHAELKSGLHSDGFLVSRILLAPENIKTLIAKQMAGRLKEMIGVLPNFVAGVPDGATALAEAVGKELDVPIVRMRKVGGKIGLADSLDPNTSILLIEDICTRGTGFAEAVNAILQTQPFAYILPFDPVIINRGGLTSVTVDTVGDFEIIAIADLRVQDWPPADCPLCKRGSKAIKPKDSDENWRRITSSQR